MGQIKALIRQLLGEGAVAEKKCFAGRRLEMIGWIFDLIARLVTNGERCRLKALHSFLAVNEFLPLPLKTVQRMAPWGTRYGNICLLIKPFTSALYFATKGKTNHYCLVTLGPQARTSVQMLRVLMLLVSIDEAAYARPLESWRPFAADADPLAVALCLAAVVGLIAVFDASLKGIGVLWHTVCADGSRRLIAGAALDIQSLHFGSDDSFQNTAEYIAATCAVRGAKILRDEGLKIDGKPRAGLWMHGDSMTALNWARKGRVKGELAINASIVAVMQSATADMPLLGDEHLPAVLNPHSDLIS
jgi:hypothetical protein